MSFKSKKGSYTVWITIIFSSIIIFLCGAIYASRQLAVSSAVDSLGRLWGLSITAEYDLMLKERYGLYGFYGNEYDIERKLWFYANESFSGKDYINIDEIRVDLDKYRLSDNDILKKQIRDTVLFQNKPTAYYLDSGTEENKSKSEYKKESNRKITNPRIINGLPSKGRGKGADATKAFDKLRKDELLHSETNTIYVFRFFKDYLNDRSLGDTYFNNEVEYIISGKLDDEKSRKDVKMKIIVIRNASNFLYLLNSTEKRRAAEVAAAAIAPKGLDIVLTFLILEAWALIEAENDIKLLYDNEKVPILKSDDTFAVTLEQVLEQRVFNIIDGQIVENENVGPKNKDEKRYIRPKKITGLSYKDYLMGLVAVTNQEDLLNRIKDLIQINGKYLYCDYFLMDDYYVGLDYAIKVNGKVHEFSKEY